LRNAILRQFPPLVQQKRTNALSYYDDEDDIPFTFQALGTPVMKTITNTAEEDSEEDNDVEMLDAGKVEEDRLVMQKEICRRANMVRGRINSQITEFVAKVANQDQDLAEYAKEFIRSQFEGSSFPYMGTSLRRERGPRENEFDVFFFAERLTYNKFSGYFAYQGEHTIKEGFKVFFQKFE
jgi:hypothetical protein